MRDFSYAFARGERVALVGPNGVGKTSFLRAIMGELPPDAGEVKIGETVRFGFYSQFVEFENPEMRVSEYVAEVAAEARGGAGGGAEWVSALSLPELLSRFQFMRGRQHTPLRELSGGERRRLQLLTALSRQPNVLVLDEPTNDLDLPTIEAVESLLNAYDGVIVLTGHDRAFLDSVAQHLLVFEGGGRIRDWPGSFSEWRDAERDADLKRQLAELIEEISTQALREADSANVVAANIQHIFAVTEQTGDGTRSTAQIVRELSRTAEELRQEQRERDFRAETERQHAAIRARGYKVEDVQKFMTERGIVKFDTALEVMDMRNSLAAPTPEALAQHGDYSMPEDQKNIFANPAKWARQKAHAIIDELKGKALVR